MSAVSSTYREGTVHQPPSRATAAAPTDQEGGSDGLRGDRRSGRPAGHQLRLSSYLRTVHLFAQLGQKLITGKDLTTQAPRHCFL